MLSPQPYTVFLALSLLLLSIASSTFTQSLHREPGINIPSTYPTIPALLPPPRTTAPSNLSLSTNKTHPSLRFETVTYNIPSTTLTLIANIGSWQLSRERILATLSAANRTVEKKPAARLLETKFTQQQGSRINTMVFEIAPVYSDKKLTWGHVATVLSDDGLPRFFRMYGVWTSTYFEVVDDERRKVLGEGAVRKWYQSRLDFVDVDDQ